MKKRLKNLHKKTLLTSLAIITAVTPIIQSIPVEAVNDSMWVNSEELTYEAIGQSNEDYSNGLPCMRQDFTIRNAAGNDTLMPNQCVYEMEYGSQVGSGQYFMSKHASVGGRAYNFRTLPVPHTEKLFRMPSTNDLTSSVYIDAYENATDVIEKGFRNINSVQYAYSLTGLSSHYAGSIVNTSTGNKVGIRNGQMGISANGEWMLARTNSGHIIRVNLETLEVLSIHSVGGGWPSPAGGFSLAIDNSGRHGVMMGGFRNSTQHALLFDLSTCDEPDPNNNINIVGGCGVRDFAPYLTNITGGSVGWNPEFSSDGSILEMNLTINNEGRRIALVAPGHEYSGLDYLALGDSFASGEGDLESEKYYLEGTDVSPNAQFLDGEKCHVSKRSYPFLLAQRMNLSGNRFKSMACSGATINDILGTKDYYGQKDRLRNDNERTVEDIENMKREALDDFTPGRAPQIDFVEKYKPKVVSISVGGNDVDFESVIKKCLMPGTCDYVDNSSKRRSKAQEVQALTYRLERVYKTIYEKSRNTKIYVMGYPKFVKKNGACDLNVRFNEAEREFLDEGVEYINSVIQAAAQRAGIAYVDLEESLGEGVLCGSDSEKSMNGLTRGDDELQALLGIMSNYYIPGIGNESYHPNQRGHVKMASAIWSATNNQGLLNYNYCPAPSLNYCPDTQVSTPSIPGYFGPNHVSVTPQRADIVEQWAQPGDVRNFKAPYLLKPNSNVELEIHSNPVSLGTFTTDSRGEFDEDIEIPDTLEPGIHTIHLKGTLLSDEEVHMYQTILVVGSEDDIDGDGINDDQQECYFVEHAGIDADFDGIDDSCDGDIGEPQLYRVRNGDTDNSENENWLYMERNTRASSITGIQNDYDPDGDGWAVVGQSATSADSGVPASFWVDEQNVPHVSIRHPETGCTQFTAANLAEVGQGQTRGLQQEATNTDTCREEAPEYDADWDGVPDNVQTLYRARNGDVDEGESPDNVYIERNVIAGEAQLNITDFSHAQNGWSIVGVSDGDAMLGMVAGEVVIEDHIPYICVDHVTDGWLVLTPESLGYVKQSDARKLKIETGISIDCEA